MASGGDIVRHLLYIIGPYIPERDIHVATRAVALARERGWLPICPSLDTTPETGAALLSRLDPETDAAVTIPGWLRGTHSVREHTIAATGGLRIYDEIAGLPTPEEQARCPRYGEYGGVSMCGSGADRCPPGMRCPISRRVNRRRVR